MKAVSGEVPSGGLSTLALSYGSLGVVYGDIGTSVLYAVRECFDESYGITPTTENVIGLMSLFFWSLMLIVVFKYVFFVMRADNRGEGGILALMALVLPKATIGKTSIKAKYIAFTGLIGASLLAADGTITPSISVLSAVEGIEIATPALHKLVVPITIGICLWFKNMARRPLQSSLHRRCYAGSSLSVSLDSGRWYWNQAFLWR